MEQHIDVKMVMVVMMKMMMMDVCVATSAPGPAPDLAPAEPQGRPGAAGLQLPRPVRPRVRCEMPARNEVHTHSVTQSITHTLTHSVK